MRWMAEHCGRGAGALALLLGVTVPGAPLLAGEFYVDPVTGVDGKGRGRTPGDPLKTLTFALGEVVDDDVTVHLSPGRYEGGLRTARGRRLRGRRPFPRRFRHISVVW